MVLNDRLREPALQRRDRSRNLVVACTMVSLHRQKTALRALLRFDGPGALDLERMAGLTSRAAATELAAGGPAERDLDVPADIIASYLIPT